MNWVRRRAGLEGRGGRPGKTRSAAARPPPSTQDLLVLTPVSTLELAYWHSRDLQTEREKLLASALELLAARRKVGLTSSLTGGVRKVVESESATTPSISVSLSLGDTLASGAIFPVSGSDC